MARKAGSKGVARFNGVSRKRKNWGYERTSPMETEHEREVRAKRVAEFLARGGTVKRYEPEQAPKD